MVTIDEVLAADPLFSTIYRAAAPLQDKRDDAGHARVVTCYAHKLLEYEAAERRIVIPAAILHDTGWSAVPNPIASVEGHISKDEEQSMRYAHQNLGAAIAHDILREAQYDSRLTNEILRIILAHDTSKVAHTPEEAIVQDADKLWRFSEEGFWADVRRKRVSGEQRYARLSADIRSEGFLHLPIAVDLAREALEQRIGEYCADAAWGASHQL